MTCHITLDMANAERKRLSVDITPHRDIVRMLDRAAREGLNPTFLTVNALRKFLLEKGYGRKKDTTP
jgi:hypothetical protein